MCGKCVVTLRDVVCVYVSVCVSISLVCVCVCVRISLCVYLCVCISLSVFLPPSAIATQVSKEEFPTTVSVVPNTQPGSRQENTKRTHTHTHKRTKHQHQHQSIQSTTNNNSNATNNKIKNTILLPPFSLTVSEE